MPLPKTLNSDNAAEQSTLNQMESQELIIHIDWSGPHSYADVASFRGPKDFGIYQVYGSHHVYGSDALLYIGKAERETFADRFAQPDHAYWCGDNHDSGRLQIYVGRLFGEATPDDETWNNYIDLAERLLIQAHRPAENKNLDLVKGKDQALQHVHVLNRSQYRDLMPEVSGARWSSRFSFSNLPFTKHFSN